MEPNMDLKNRFDKLQKTSETPVSEDKVVKPVLTIKQVDMTSSYPEIHEAIRDCHSGQSYDWRGEYRKGMKRPSELSIPHPYLFELQGRISELLGKPILFTCYEKESLELAAKKLNSYIVSRPKFWRQALEGVAQIHFRSEKGKIQLWLRSDDSTFIRSGKVKTAMENEYLINSRQLKSYGVYSTEDWVELHLEIIDRPADYTEKGQNL